MAVLVPSEEGVDWRTKRIANQVRKDRTVGQDEAGSSEAGWWERGGEEEEMRRDIGLKRLKSAVPLRFLRRCESH